MYGKNKVMLLEQDFQRVLFISHNAFSTTLNNGKTYSSFFEGWPKSKLAQLYFQNEKPNFNVCNNYFHITDEQVLMNKKKNIGKKIDETNFNNIQKTQSSVHSYVRKNPKAILTLIRDIVWGINRWKNRNLLEWLNEFKPEVIFFVGGGSLFSYKITKFIASYFNIPIVLYFTDDYLTIPSKTKTIEWLNSKRLNKYLKKFNKSVDKIFVIGDDMKMEYQNKFNKQCISVMNSVDTEKYNVIRLKREINHGVEKSKIKIAYFGGIHLNRWKTISVLSQCIREIQKEGKHFDLDIYCVEKPAKEILEEIHHPPYSNFKGGVNEEHIISKMMEYDVLLHVESFDTNMIFKTRLSISTKIPEYLACSKPILGIGPSEISSIKYLKRETESFIINNIDKVTVLKVLNEIFNKKDELNLIGEVNYLLAHKNHDSYKEREKIKSGITSAVN